ncbi:MAG: hypothetical protein KDD82_18905 [Planctomycetes bacterium]|nr:hypothetical protein [Planctomycetota bacterium]
MGLLDARLEAEVEVVAEAKNFAGRNYWELRLTSDDGQTLHLYEGQLKEFPQVELREGRRYRAVLMPFINNRWVEVKIHSLTPA